MANLTINTILKYALSVGASDIHISEWKSLVFRINWKLVKKEEAWLIDNIKVKQILLELMYEDKEKARLFLQLKDLDFWYLHQDWTSFRVNAFHRLWKISLVLRVIKNEAVPIKDLGLPSSVFNLTKLKQGLVLITGPTWSWKSTTMVSFLEEINQTRGEHIITLEDPVEYVFTDKKSIFSQRNLWLDTGNFPAALKAAMREDPDIIMVWEMRDEETVKAALELAETWHLVISTLHTSSAVATITRLLSFFPVNVQESMKHKISDALQWVVSQRLIPKAEGKWRVAIFEVMLMNTAIKNLIRQWEFMNIQSNIETGSRSWMIAMKTYADKLRDQWIVNEVDYENYFKEENM